MWLLQGGVVNNVPGRRPPSPERWRKQERRGSWCESAFRYACLGWSVRRWKQDSRRRRVSSMIQRERVAVFWRRRESSLPSMSTRPKNHECSKLRCHLQGPSARRKGPCYRGHFACLNVNSSEVHSETQPDSAESLGAGSPDPDYLGASCRNRVGRGDVRSVGGGFYRPLPADKLPQKVAPIP